MDSPKENSLFLTMLSSFNGSRIEKGSITSNQNEPDIRPVRGSAEVTRERDFSLDRQRRSRGQKGKMNGPRQVSRPPNTSWLGNKWGFLVRCILLSGWRAGSCSWDGRAAL